MRKTATRNVIGAQGPQSAATARKSHRTKTVSRKPSSNSEANSEIKIGGRLKHARLIKGLRLQDLADKLDCSESFLSKIENNKVRPSLSMLHQITVALDINISILFADQADQNFEQIQIIRAKDRQTIKTNPSRSGPGITLERLVAMERSSLIEANIHCIDPGGHTDGVINHEGEEIGFLLEGQLDLELDGVWYSLSEGDSFFFRSTLPHGYKNPGNKLTRILWVNTPPTF
ncbi:MAG: cupin domain-containing protein [Bradyrhizobiaceae bacterium]|nr:MAG: cupin domain-containing protein [Bradyrhizobiaceae bacterium]